MLAWRHKPRASISSAQNGNTGQNPRQAKNRLNARENRQIEPKKSLAPEGVREQLGASSMRFSMAIRITQGCAIQSSSASLGNNTPATSAAPDSGEKENVPRQGAAIRVWSVDMFASRRS